jgi:hypothetical protein
MEYLEILEKKEMLINMQHQIGEAARVFGEKCNQEFYTLSIFTHVTDMGNSFNYATSMIVNQETEMAAEHTLNALTSALGKAHLLPLMKAMIKDYEEHKLK